jgi:hypothetical protein
MRDPKLDRHRHVGPTGMCAPKKHHHSGLRSCDLEFWISIMQHCTNSGSMSVDLIILDQLTLDWPTGSLAPVTSKKLTLTQHTAVTEDLWHCFFDAVQEEFSHGCMSATGTSSRWHDMLVQKFSVGYHRWDKLLDTMACFEYDYQINVAFNKKPIRFLIFTSNPAKTNL